MLQQRMLFGPCYLGSKGLQHAKEIGPAKGKASWELQMFEKANFRQSFLLFFDGPAKNQQAYVSERCPKTLWKYLWAACKNLQKKSNNWLQKNKETTKWGKLESLPS